jgi:hypothetical protein
MNHELGLQPASTGDDSLACGKPSVGRNNLLALLEDFRAPSPVDRPIHPSTSHQARVGGIHYCISLLNRNVAFNQPQLNSFDYPQHSPALL